MKSGIRIIVAGIALLASLAGLSACEVPWLLSARAGLREFEQFAAVDVPGGRVNAVGGNLLLERTDLQLETALGPWAVQASWNSASGAWLWNHQVRFDGSVFRDASGAEHDLSSLSDGAPVPGTHWTRIDADTVRTRGGLEFHFDTAGDLERVNWRSGAYPRLEFVSTAAGIDIQQCMAPPVCNPLFEIVENAKGETLSVTGVPLGRSATFTWDAWGRLTEARDALDVEESWPGRRYEYDGDLISSVTNSEGERIEYTYQAGRRIHTVTQIGEGDPSHMFSLAWQSGGLYPLTHTNPLGGVTVFRADVERRLARIDRPASGETTLLSWTDLRPTSISLPTGETTSFGYTNDDLTSIVHPSGNQTSIQPSANGVGYSAPFSPVVASASDSLGVLLTRTFDANGRVLVEANGEGDSHSFTWNLSSKLASTTSPAGVVREYPLYGVHGQWLEVEGDVADRRSVDAAGNVVVPSIRVQPGGELSRDYDANRNVASQHVAATDQGSVTASSVISIERRSDGQIRSIVRPGGSRHEFGFDALGRAVLRSESVDGVLRFTSFEYDAAGHVTAVTHPNGMRTETEWDAFGRLVRRRSLSNGVVDGQIDFTHQAGRLIAATDLVRGTTETYLYDAAGRLASTVQSTGERVDLEYDLRSRLTAEVFRMPDQSVAADVGYAYDLAGRRTRVVDRLAGVTLLETRFVDGQIVEEQFGNGLTRVYTFDPETGRLASTTTTDGAGTQLESTAVSHSFEVAPIRQQHRTTTTTPLATTTEEYWMSRAGNLATLDGRVGTRVFAWNDGAVASRSWTWNLLSHPVNTAAGDVYTYDAEGERLLSASLPGRGVAVSYAWDEAGFATSRNGLPISWTGAGRMASHGATSFEWDQAGRIVAIDVGGVTREFRLFGGRVESGSQIPGIGLLDLGSITLELGSSGVRYRHVDFRGNVSFVSDESGAVVGHFQYGPFGRVASYGSGFDDRGFESQREVDGLIIMGARIYDPVVGRFLSPDPVLQIVNQYTYAQGNPIDYVDAGGRSIAARTVTKVALQAVVIVSSAIAAHPLTPPPAKALATTVALTAAAALAMMEAEEGNAAAAADGTALDTGANPDAAGGVAPQPNPGSCECKLPGVVIEDNHGTINFFMLPFTGFL